MVAGSANQGSVCYVGLGSNLGDSVAYLNSAIEALRSCKHIFALQVSPFYRSKPHGPQDQPDYLNAVASFETSLQPEKLLTLLQMIENDNARMREGVVRWGARTLDLDLLFYGGQIINTKRLTVPHPQICKRAFVLLPLADLLGKCSKSLKITSKTTIKDCIDKLSAQDRADTVKLTKKR
jgi:2-amino-4-hydroxy-6-hydroxymethyldihydropteridine diphosphokinase